MFSLKTANQKGLFESLLETKAPVEKKVIHNPDGTITERSSVKKCFRFDSSVFLFLSQFSHSPSPSFFFLSLFYFFKCFFLLFLSHFLFFNLSLFSLFFSFTLVSFRLSLLIIIAFTSVYYSVFSKVLEAKIKIF